jgi:hypothetical protein
VQYDVVNMSSDTLYDCAIAQATDPDLGHAGNDHLGFYARRPELRTAFVWTEQESKPYGALAITLLEGPVAGSDGFIDNSRRLEYMLGGRVNTSPNWDITVDPKMPEERYDFMTLGRIDGDMGPGDRRMLIATGTFNMRPGDTAHYAIAYSVLDKMPDVAQRSSDPSLNAVAVSDGGLELESLIDHLAADYYDGVRFTSSVPVDLPSSPVTAIAVAPNPVHRDAVVRYAITHRSNVSLKILDALGQVVARQAEGMAEAGDHEAKLDMNSLPGGVYLLIVETELGSLTTTLMVTR